jgi:hypothetical protein
MKRIGAALLPLILLACGSAVGPTPSPSPTSSPSPTPSTEGFYLRAWYTQALAVEYTFNWLPVMTIHDGLAIDGNVAVPAIFPGPLLIMPNVRPISAAGQALLIDQARQLGPLGDMTDFSGDQLMPGAPVGHIEIVVDGVRRELIGDPSQLPRCGGQRCLPDPGTPAAFAVFWQQLTDLGSWLGAELGPTTTYTPLRLALATIAPQPSDLLPNIVAWPLAGTFTDFGQPWALAGSRCAVVEGTDLDTLLPALQAANQLTIFVDPTNEQRSLLVRVLVPLEPSPCGDG